VKQGEAAHLTAHANLAHTLPTPQATVSLNSPGQQVIHRTPYSSPELRWAWLTYSKACEHLIATLYGHDASLPVAYRLYLPADWVKDQARRRAAKVPETIAFQTKPEIALEQIKAAKTAGLPEDLVLMDAR
jgi:hypothetical protein